MIRRGRPYLEPRLEPASPETEQLEREGFTIVRSLLSDPEVAELRAETPRSTPAIRPTRATRPCRRRTPTCSATPC
jgi:hypothetical protein